MVVGAAGMLVELFLASLALFLWLNMQPGFARSLAYNTVFIAGVTTMLFNANPLLRYDGYYILADLLEIPNLRAQSSAYLVYLCERYLFGWTGAEPPNSSRSERTWFVAFGVLSSLYRVFVVVLILLYIADKLFNLGALLAMAAAALWMVYPALKGGYYLLASPRIRSVRARAITASTVLLAAAIGFVLLVPMPYRSRAEGVVWIPEEAFVRAGAEGFVEDVRAVSGGHVTDGEVLLRLGNPLIEVQERILAARARELEARWLQTLNTSPVETQIAEREIEKTRERLQRIREEIASLSVRSRATGTLIVPVPEDLPGRFVRKGDLIGYVVQPDRITLRTVVSQERIEMVRNSTYGVLVRLSERFNRTVPATIKRIIPGATEALPAPALGMSGGGQIATDPRDERGLTAVQKVFQVDLELPPQSALVNLGGRGYVRFDHGWTPLAVQWYFEIRQLFLARFDV